MHTLSASERLKSRKSIDLLFREGRGFTIAPVRTLYQFMPEQDSALKAGFAVSSRSFKKATDRNRVKRLLREAYRTQKPALAELLEARQQKLAVFFIYNGHELPDYDLISAKLAVTLAKIIRTIS